MYFKKAWVTNLSSQSCSSCLSNEFLGNCLLQYWHSEGSSDTALSTARFLVADVLLISTLQLGQVAVSSRNLASANMWEKHPAHIRWPLLHWNYAQGKYYMREITLMTDNHNWKYNPEKFLRRQNISWEEKHFILSLIISHPEINFKMQNII